MAAPLAPLSPPSSSLDHPFRNFTTLFPRPHKPTHFIPKASSSSDPDPEPQPDPKQPKEDPFESRLAQVRLRYRSGTGKKAEMRKEKKVKRGSEAGFGSGSGKPGGVLLPPVPLKEPVSGGVKVEFGFSPYSERVNGRLAGLGLVALLLVELGTGKSVLNYHTPAIVFIQLYFMAAMSALFFKYEKEKVSVWPFGDTPPTSPANNDV